MFMRPGSVAWRTGDQQDLPGPIRLRASAGDREQCSQSKKQQDTEEGVGYTHDQSRSAMIR
jgi:hypothetical protein